MVHDLQFGQYVGPENQNLCKAHYLELWASYKQRLLGDKQDPQQPHGQHPHGKQPKAQKVISTFLKDRQGGVLVRIIGCSKPVKVLATPKKVYLYPAYHKAFGLRKSYFWEDVTLDSWGKKGVPVWSKQVRVEKQPTRIGKKPSEKKSFTKEI